MAANIVVVGGGAGGLELVCKLGRRLGPAAVTLVDSRLSHIWKPSLHEVAAGTLDIHAFLAFMLQPLTEHPLPRLLDWRAQFLAEKIEPIILPKAIALLERHRANDDTLLIITATNRFITAPIAARLGVETLLATECGMENGRYTGHVAGVPCYQAGKVVRLNE